MNIDLEKEILSKKYAHLESKIDKMLNSYIEADKEIPANVIKELDKMTEEKEDVFKRLVRFRPPPPPDTHRTDIIENSKTGDLPLKIFLGALLALSILGTFLVLRYGTM